MRKQLLTIPILALLITSCAPRPIIRLSPSTDQGVWLRGQQFVFDTTSDVNVYIAFERDCGEAHSFSVEYLNKGETSFLVDPARVEVVTHPINSAKFPSKSYSAIDPELRLLAMDKAISRSQAQSANASIIAAVVLGAGMVAVASQSPNRTGYERQQNQANMVVTGVEVAAISSAVHQDQAIDISNDKQMWEDQTLRKTTLAPNMSIQGLVFIPKDINAKEYEIALPVRGKMVHFIFLQNIINAITPDAPAAGMP